MRKRIYVWRLLLLFFCLCYVGCKEEESPTNTVIEGFLSNPVPSRRGAVVKGRFEGNVTGVKEFGFLYSTAQSLEPNDPATKKKPISEEFSVMKDYTVTLTDLEPGKEYYYCLYISNGVNMRKTTSSSFKTTKTSKALLGKMELVEVGEYSITVSCAILEDGGTDIMQCGFYYKKQTDTKFEPKIATLESFKMTIDKLSPGVKYDLFPYATNALGMTCGDTIHFTTNGFESPVVKTFGIGSDMYGSDWALLKGAVEKDGATAVKEMGFCYTTENREPTIADTRVPVSDKSKFEYKLTGLNPGGTYYVRAFARNETKVGYGEKVEFTTKASVDPTCNQPVADEITDTSFLLKAAVQRGNGVITRMGFCYSAVKVPTIDDAKVEVAQIESGYLSAIVTGLKPFTEYTVRTFIVSGTKTIYSQSRQVKTTKDRMPVVGEIAFSDIKTKSFNAHIDITSHVTIKKQIFLYSTTNKTPRRGGQNVKELECGVGGNATFSEGITPNTLYYVCAYVLNQADKEVYSSVKTVTTQEIALPLVQNFSVTQSGAVADVMASFSSDESILESGICYSTTNKTPTVGDTKTTVSISGNKVSGKITGLTISTTYYIRVYIKNRVGIGYSSVKELKVDGDLPIIKNIIVTKNENVAHVTASFTSGWPISEVGICYSTSKSEPTINDSKITGTTSDDQISVQLEDLKPATTYWIRAYVKSSAGIGYSVVQKLVIANNVPDKGDNESPDKK